MHLHCGTNNFLFQGSNMHVSKSPCNQAPSTMFQFRDSMKPHRAGSQAIERGALENVGDGSIECTLDCVRRLR